MKKNTFTGISAFFSGKIVMGILISFVFCTYIPAEPFDYTTLNGELYLTDEPVYFGEENF